jgi:acyl-coenzyme A thioesterase PaaI-like protein
MWTAHFWYLAALADQALTFAAMTSLPGGGMVFRTINLSMTFLRVGQ